MKQTSVSNHAGVTGTKGFAAGKGGAVRVNQRLAEGSGSGGGSKVRPNGVMPSTDGTHRDPGKYLGPHKKNAENFRPTKGGSVR